MKSGFVSILGRPNVGKSTLLNHLVRHKLAGVTPKPQTTRGMIRGILTRPEGQIVFLDTPGFHEPRDLLGEWMIREIHKSVEGADLIYWMMLPDEMPDSFEQGLVELLKRLEVPVFLVLSQIDRFSKEDLIPLLVRAQKIFPFREFIPISAQKGIQTDLLVQKTLECLPEGEAFFAADQISDQNERFIAAEIIREKLFLRLRQEIPYGTAVLIEEYKERSERMVYLKAVIAVEREAHKAILIGEKGQKLKEIGQEARRDLEATLGKGFYVELWVKAFPNWKKDEQQLRRLGFE